MVFLSNPNNPIGTYVTRPELEAFLERVPRRVLIVYDEAYYEYARGRRDYPCGTRYLARQPNLIVTRTFSKAYGLAGLRVGYGLARPEIVEAIERVRPPFNVGRVSQAAAVAALEDHEHLERTRRTNKDGMKYLTRELLALGFRVVPSLANFLTFDTGGDGVAIAQALLRQGVIVRSLAGWRMPELIRVTVGKPAENRRFIKSLKQVVGTAGTTDKGRR
ncbi:pyridoxal phosphate-dependent aminotransferase [Candidatus Sumerlaeota bacterium]